MDTNYELNARIRSCTLCPLSKARTLGVPAHRGNLYTGLMFLSDYPAKEEDLSGRPFVGNAGAFLSECLEDLGQSIEALCLTNRLRCRPYGEPPVDALYNCDGWTKEEIAYYAPDTVILAGYHAINPIFGQGPVSNHVGTYTTVDGITYVATYNPAAVLRNPDYKRQFLSDLALGFDIHGRKIRSMGALLV